MIVVLTGGNGGAKFVDGLQGVVPPEDLTIIVNTGDDHEWWGLYVSPDIDSITYVLDGMLSSERGWGVQGDTFHCLAAMKRLAEPAWFSVGDRDLAVHLLRSKLLAEGITLSEATRIIANRLGLRSRILPMTDQRVETRIETSKGEISFEEYFVQRRYQDPVIAVRFAAAHKAQPAPGVTEAIKSAKAVLIAPSNPITSIGPILAVPGIRDALRGSSAPVVAVSPMIGKAAISGPAAALMRAQGFESSITGVASVYQDFLDVLIVDDSDYESAKALKSERMETLSTNILMRTAADKIRIARIALNAVAPSIVEQWAEAG